MARPQAGAMARREVGAPLKDPIQKIITEPLLQHPVQHTNGIQVMTLAQMTHGGLWQLEQLHVRDHHLFLWITRGQGRLLLHGLRRGFGAHNAIFIPAGKLASIEVGRHIQGQALIIPNNGRVQLPDRTQQLRLQDGLAQAELTGLFDDLRRELHEDRPFVNESLTAIASLVSIWLRRQMQIQGAPPLASAAERIVRRFCDILSDNFQSGRPMQDYAEDLGITPTHLTRVSRQCSGLTAADMVSQVVQHKARIMLTQTDLPINEIADKLGFGSAAYFTRFSQQHFGAAPSQVRKTAAPRG
ncbi:AraC family transcriptional regulator, transcriptional activator of pobA [Shimia gijangensis]|uniref:AraC family transcriptional regulator, transcriptional activator of pobA n=2 Tax=Shimia gijangensis TaxID=1470563 RepID=A0A1M6HVZ2_9RHOB|nr:AraC family transcriptional regulator, transcriptional activator of pobA [Shimia gijangensis]